MTSQWIKSVQQYRINHPNLSYKDCLKALSKGKSNKISKKNGGDLKSIGKKIVRYAMTPLMYLLFKKDLDRLAGK